MTPDQLFPYQQRAANFQCYLPESALWVDMGLGKTVITLTSIAHLLKIGHLRAVLVVAPVRVCRLVWKQEAGKWTHTQHLTFSSMLGDKANRVTALLKTANVYLINYENLGWLSQVIQTYYVSKGKPVPFDGIVFDEISKCKNSTTNRVKALLPILPMFKWSTGLTGTPSSNGYKDLHGQYLVLDKGKRLGISKTHFEKSFYHKDGPYKIKAFEDTEEAIKELIGDMTLEMSAVDYNPLPDMIINNVTVELTPELRKLYETMERELFVTLDSGVDVDVFNQASLTNKCLQFSNGSIYHIRGSSVFEEVHDMKLDALEDIVEEAAGQQILCSYSYRSDATRIMERFKDLKPINLTECHSQKSLTDAMNRWANGECRLMIGHPACLHPSTQVLTELRGWVNITDVDITDKVFDGVEFVNHSGCVYSGYKEVIEVLGIKMTPSHKLLINGEWVEAKNVQDSTEVRNEGISFREKTKNIGISGMSGMRKTIRDVASERYEKQSRGKETLSTLHNGHISQHDRYTDMENMARDVKQVERQVGQGLWSTWNRSMRGMERLQRVLCRYVLNILRQLNYRKKEREWELLERELCMGDDVQTTVEQENDKVCDIQRHTNPFSRTVSNNRIEQNDVDYATEQRNDWRRRGEGRGEFSLRKRETSKEKSNVYDLVNCGKRHQFVIRNQKGEVFISHNSMGHGIDGLQARGNILVWFGLNWSLDLYSQFNARIRRQGQGKPVICHRILALNTLDEAQALALEEKAVTQDSLRAAIKQYHDAKVRQG